MRGPRNGTWCVIAFGSLFGVPPPQRGARHRETAFRKANAAESVIEIEAEFDMGKR